MTRRAKTSLIIFIVGILSLTAAFGISVYHFYLEHRAGEASSAAVAELKKMIVIQEEPIVLREQVPNADTQSGTAAEGTAAVDGMESMENSEDGVVGEGTDDTERSYMPSRRLDEKIYVAILSIPALDLELPVMNVLTNSNLKVAPCLYRGSIYQNDIIIGAHNFSSHFGNLKSLEIGDRVILTDMEGNEFSYQVIGTEILEKTALDELTAGEWDLTLFTCTYGGEQRVIIRCQQDV